MKPKLKRYIYKNGLDIVAPLKCGTRWLEGLDVDTRISRTTFTNSDLKEHIHSGTTFICRGVRKHFLSALKTELFICPEKTPLDIVIEMESGICDHWYPHLYRELYPIWEKTGFRFHKLRALSELTPTAPALKYISTEHEFRLSTEWSSVESILSSLSPKHLIRLERLISDEEKWLKSMLKPQYSERSWEEYSDLEDSILEMKIRVKDMEMEVSRIRDSKLWNDFEKTIRELRISNNKLQAKLDYTEWVMKKLPTKLI
jgi:hypothetical protein